MSLVVGSDDALWGIWPDAIGRIDMSGNTSVFPLPSGDSAYGLTEGPDGAIWFTESNGSVQNVQPVANIGRIATNGAITFYPLPTSGLSVEQIAVGPDNSLWYTTGQTSIGRITTSGTLLPQLMVRAFIASFIPGTNGAMYFLAADPSGTEIACINASGAFSYDPQTQPMNSIAFGGPGTIGPDGNIYFVYNVSIGKVSQFPPGIAPAAQAHQFNSRWRLR